MTTLLQLFLLANFVSPTFQGYYVNFLKWVKCITIDEVSVRATRVVPERMEDLCSFPCRSTPDTTLIISSPCPAQVPRRSSYTCRIFQTFAPALFYHLPPHLIHSFTVSVNVEERKNC